MSARICLYLRVLILCSFCNLTVVQAATPDPVERGPRVAVLTLQDQAGLERFSLELLLEALRGVALREGLNVMTRENMLALLPPGVRLEDCIGSCEIETGRQLGAAYIITGAVGRPEPGGALFVLARLHETQSGRLLAQVRAQAGSPVSLARALREEGGALLKPLRRDRAVSESDRGLLYLEYRPQGASLQVDGTPLPKRWRRRRGRGELLSLPPGRHRIQLSAPGFMAREEQVELRLGQPQRLELRLARRQRAPSCAGDECLSTVQVYTRPAGAELWIDGAPAGVSTQPLSDNPEVGGATLKVPAGQHWLSARLPGHRSVERLLRLKPREI